MKKIRLTEKELKRMIVNVMEQVTSINEGEPNYTIIEEYEQKFDSHLMIIYDSIYDIIDLFHELSGRHPLTPKIRNICWIQ